MCVFSHLMSVYFHELPMATKMRHTIPQLFKIFSD